MSFAIEFVSPESVLFSGEARQVVARTRGGGDIAFLTGHEPFIGSLQPSEVRVYGDGDDFTSFAVRGGFVSVTGDSVTVLSDEAVAVADIDVEAVQSEADSARTALETDEDNAFAQADLQWAEVRLQLAGVDS